MARYHINSKGEVGLCRAQAGGCPFGSAEEHYPTRQAAAQAYEQAMTAHSVPRKHQYAQKELVELAKTATEAADFATILAQGSERTLRSLARNEATPADVLAKAAERQKDEAARRAFVKHPAFPVSAMRPDEFAQLVKEADWLRRGELLKSDDLTDAHLTAVGTGSGKNGASINYYDALTNSKNKLSQDKIVELAEASWMSMERGLASGRYPLKERINDFDLDLARTAVRKITDGKTLALLATRAVEEDHQGMLTQLASNPATPPETLTAVAEQLRDSDGLMAAYRNKNTPEDTRDMLRDTSAEVDAYNTIEELEERFDGCLGDEIGWGEEEAVGVGKQRIVRFDRDAVRKLGLSEQELDAYVRYHRGNYLFGTSYDARTGIYSGYTD